MIHLFLVENTDTVAGNGCPVDRQKSETLPEIFQLFFYAFERESVVLDLG